MQTNWIGRSEGAEIDVHGRADDQQAGGQEIRVFTTRPDTLFGATFMVLAPEHPLVDELTARRAASRGRGVPLRAAPQVGDRSPVDRPREDRRCRSGATRSIPINGERIPIWIADYVLLGYGTGAIMAVPAHDERDFAFAQTVRPAHSPGRRAARLGRRPEHAGQAYVAHTGGRGAGQLGRLQRHARA